MYSYSRGGGALGGPILLILFCVGMYKPTWYIGYRYRYTGKVVAQMGIFEACGFNSTFQLLSHGNNNIDNCVSLLDPGAPGWMRAVQVLAILSGCMLVVITFVLLYILGCKKVPENRNLVLISTVWIITGVILLIHPLIFVSHLPTTQEKHGDITITMMYWGGLYLHCVVAGAVNFISLVGGLCCCVWYML